MKKDIHPDYHPVVFQDAGTGHQFLTSESHPFWTGAQRLMDTAGRVEKFQRRYGGLARRAKKS